MVWPENFKLLLKQKIEHKTKPHPYSITVLRCIFNSVYQQLKPDIRHEEVHSKHIKASPRLRLITLDSYWLKRSQRRELASVLLVLWISFELPYSQWRLQRSASNFITWHMLLMRLPPLLPSPPAAQPPSKCIVTPQPLCNCTRRRPLWAAHMFSATSPAVV